MAGYEDIVGFTSVDRSTDPGYYLRIIDQARGLHAMAESRPDVLQSMRLRHGMRVLEIGCGLGADALEFARRIGPTGEVVAIDISEVMVAEAARRAEGIDLPVSFAIGDITKLDYPDGSFDVCRAERVLLYLDDVPGALAEMVRVTRSGGRVSIFDVDFGTFVIDHPDRDMTDRICALMRDAFPQGRLGRALPRLMRDAGLYDVGAMGRVLYVGAPDFLPAFMDNQLKAACERGEFSEAELRGWWAALDARDLGPYVASMMILIVGGTKP